LSFKESRELEELPAKLEALEREQKDLAARLADPALYQDRTVDLRALNARHDEIDAALTSMLARWEELEAKR
jgi:ATP-binding cassette subfamily F protein uup